MRSFCIGLLSLASCSALAVEPPCQPEHFSTHLEHYQLEANPQLDSHFSAEARHAYQIDNKLILCDLTVTFHFDQKDLLLTARCTLY